MGILGRYLILLFAGAVLMQICMLFSFVATSMTETAQSRKIALLTDTGSFDRQSVLLPNTVEPAAGPGEGK